MSMLKRLGIDLHNLVEAYREKMPARDIEALAEDVVSRIRAPPPARTWNLRCSSKR